MRKYTTRYAAWDDHQKVADLYVENLWHIAHIAPDILTVLKSIYQAIHQTRVIVIERDVEMIGCASFVEGTYWFTPEKMLFDTGFFIAAKYRKTRAAAVLFNALKAEANKRGGTLIMGAGTKDPTVAPIMAKRYPQIGAAFMVTH